jgi:hypothetical protein
MSLPAYSIVLQILTAQNSVGSGSDAGEDYDNHNFDSDDDWGTLAPRKRRTRSVEDEDEDEDILGRIPRKRGNAKGGEGAGSRASHSPSASASANGGKSTPSPGNFRQPLTSLGDDDDDDDDDGAAASELPRARNNSPGIFVAENEELLETTEPLVVKGKSTLTRPQNLLRKIASMDGLKRARAIKAEIKDNVAVLQSLQNASGGTDKAENDPEDDLIKTLREEQDMSWTDIANFLNQERRDRGESATFTDAAVYSRFVRSVPRIAIPVSEIGFDPKDYKHLQNPAQFTKTEGSGTISKAGKKRVKSFDNAKELESNMRKLIKDNHAELGTAEKTEQLMQAVAKVERNFWVLVADEMERVTTKLYPPDVLASRYHDI